MSSNTEDECDAVRDGTDVHAEAAFTAEIWVHNGGVLDTFGEDTLRTN